jgi:hypothetical protein
VNCAEQLCIHNGFWRRDVVFVPPRLAYANRVRRVCRALHPCIRAHQLRHACLLAGFGATGSRACSLVKLLACCVFAHPTERGLAEHFVHHDLYQRFYYHSLQCQIVRYNFLSDLAVLVAPLRRRLPGLSNL